MEVLAFVHDGMKRGAVGQPGAHIWQSRIPCRDPGHWASSREGVVKQAFDLFQS